MNDRSEKMNLWQNNSCADWRAALDRYPDIVDAQQVNGLRELDAWYCTELPALIRARTPAFITRDELERVTVWKMKRGVWRERNRLLVIGNAAPSVKKISAQAFAAVPDPRQPVDLLSTFAGVGPATASGVLACYAPDIYPFFDELVAHQIPKLGPVAFTAPYYQRYAAALRDRAEKINRECDDSRWTAHDVSQALWANSGGKAALKPPLKSTKFKAK